MTRLERAAARIGAGRAAALTGRVAEAAAGLAGVEVGRDGADVTIAGRGLARRMVDEPALRVIGSLAR